MWDGFEVTYSMHASTAPVPVPQPHAVIAVVFMWSLRRTTRWSWTSDCSTARARSSWYGTIVQVVELVCLLSRLVRRRLQHELGELPKTNLTKPSQSSPDAARHLHFGGIQDLWSILLWDRQMVREAALASFELAKNAVKFYALWPLKAIRFKFCKNNMLSHSFSCRAFGIFTKKNSIKTSNSRVRNWIHLFLVFFLMFFF